MCTPAFAKNTSKNTKNSTNTTSKQQSNNSKGNREQQAPPEGRPGEKGDITIARVTKVNGNTITVAIRDKDNEGSETTETYDISSATITKGNRPPMGHHVDKGGQKPNGKPGKQSNNENSDNTVDQSKQKENSERPEPPTKPSDGKQGKTDNGNTRTTESKDKNSSENVSPSYSACPELPKDMPQPRDNDNGQSKGNNKQGSQVNKPEGRPGDQDETASISDIKEGIMVEIKLDGNKKVTSVRIDYITAASS